MDDDTLDDQLSEEMDDLLSSERNEVRSAITRRCISYTYKSLQDRYRESVKSSTKDKRLAEFKKTTQDGGGGLVVLKNKLAELALVVYHEKPNETVYEYLGYVMAALAGQPGKEILVINSKEAAANLSWHLLRYLGYRLKSQVSDSAKKQKRQKYYPVLARSHRRVPRLDWHQPNF